jgi:small subunit ribosomal protein S17
MPKRVAIGVVTSDKMAKTRRVEIPRLVRHPKYGKFVRRKTICYAHDEEEQSQAGDTVEIVESRPVSKTKRWQLVKVVSKSTAVDVAALRAAAKLEQDQQENNEA